MGHQKNIYLAVYWVILLCAALLLVDVKSFPVKRTILRKYFHAIALLLFIPGMINNVSLYDFISH
jgi:hypothetical protein